MSRYEKQRRHDQSHDTRPRARTPTTDPDQAAEDDALDEAAAHRLVSLQLTRKQKEERSYEKHGGKWERVWWQHQVLWNFAVGDDTPRGEHLQALEWIGRISQDFVVIQIDGHTSASGEEAQNDTLALARAMAVKQALVGAGVKVPIVTNAHGETKPRVSETDPELMAMNRRVEIKMIRANVPAEKEQAAPPAEEKPEPPPKLRYPCAAHTWQAAYHRALARTWTHHLGGPGFRDSGGGNIEKPEFVSWDVHMDTVFPDREDRWNAWNNYSGVYLPEARGAPDKYRRMAEEDERNARRKVLCTDDVDYVPEKPRRSEDLDPGDLDGISGHYKL